MNHNHPDFRDKIFLKIYPRYLYQGQKCNSIAEINVGVINKLPGIKPEWKIMDFVYLETGSLFIHLGLASHLHFSGEILPAYTILEVVESLVDVRKSPGKQVFPGDLICITPFDRKFIEATTAYSPLSLNQKLIGVIAPP